ncbi:MAG: CHRD domain-containing protein [Cellvibrionaceae bacterium]
MRKVKTLGAFLGASIVLAACGGGNNSNSNNAEPLPAEEVTIRGSINDLLPSAVLPSAAIPSATLPSRTLPSMSLPSFEIEEFPTSLVELRSLELNLQRAQQVSVDPLTEFNRDARAQAQFSLNEITGEISATVTATNLDPSDRITMVHIHSAFAGKNGPVLVGFEATADPLVFTLSTHIDDLADVSGNDLAAFLAGGWYLNLHTESNPSGLLRGQLLTEDVDTVRVVLEADQEVLLDQLPSVRDTSAIAYFTYNIGGDDSVIVNLQTLGFSASMAHVHGGFAGENGRVLIGLNDVSENIVGASSGTFWSSDLNATLVDRQNMLNGGYYLNAHSAQNPAGEVRGQILPNDTRVERVVLQTEQEVPAVISAASDQVGGVAYITTNNDNLLRANVQVNGFTPFLDAPIGPVHLHRAFAGDTGPVAVVLDEVLIDDGNGNLINNTFYRATTDSATVSAFVAADYYSGRNYINVHSAANPTGEIRAQFTPSDIQAVRVELSTDQQIADVSIDNPNAEGLAYVTIDSTSVNDSASSVSVVANVRTRGFEAVEPGPSLGAVHLHDGFAGSNGDIAITLDDTAAPSDDVTQGSFFISNDGEPIAVAVEDVNDFLSGGYYFNVHSAENVSGELRGQVTPDNVQVIISALEGAQQNPAIANAEGIAGRSYTTLNTEDETLRINVNVAGFVPFLNAPVGPVHLHSGFAGENGPVILPLQSVNGSDVNYSGTEIDAIAAIDFDQLLQGGYYINVHSEANASGELRGQIVPEGIEAVRIELQGQQENPAVISAEGISGVTYVTVDTKAETIVLTTAVTGFTPFLNAPVGPVHLHNAFAGENGPVILPLQPVNGSDVNFRATQVDILSGQTLNFTDLAAGAYYINVHSADNPSGELRGQVVSSNSRVLRAELNGAQELPTSISTLATGVGYLTVTDFANGQFVSTLSLSGLQNAVATVNVGGANNIPFVDLEPSDNGISFSSPEGPVRSLDGILSGAYAFEASGTELQELQ